MNPIEFHRLFLAISVPGDVRGRLRQWQLELQGLLRSCAVHWTKPEQFHLTLKFLGSVPVADTGALRQAVKAVCRAAPAMRLRAEGGGCFPPSGLPRVLWVEIKTMDGLLIEFQRQLEFSVQRFAEKRETKKFTAHVTLARFERLPGPAVQRLTAAMAVGRTFGQWTATEVQLVKSSLMPAGPAYAIIDTLRTKNDESGETFL
ncbi:MAG: RNA 2',3'-cyclic phosphodiesterase [Limisphaerales bacterium]